MGETHLVVHWSAEESRGIRRAEKREIAAYVTAIVCVVVSMLTAFGEEAGMFHGRPWLSLLLLAGAIVGLATFLGSRLRRSFATRAERDLLEDDGVHSSALAEAWFVVGGNRTGQDRGVLTVDGERLLFVGGRASCSLDVRGATRIYRPSLPGLNEGHLVVMYDNGDLAAFRFLRGGHDRRNRRKGEVLAAIDRLRGYWR